MYNPTLSLCQRGGNRPINLIQLNIPNDEDTTGIPRFAIYSLLLLLSLSLFHFTNIELYFYYKYYKYIKDGYVYYKSKYLLLVCLGLSNSNLHSPLLK